MGLILLLLSGLVIAWAIATLHTAYMLTHPPRRTLAWALARSKPAEPGAMGAELGGPRAFTAWMLRSRGVELPVWDLPGDDPAGPIVIMTHGWGESRLVNLQRVEPFVRSASRVVLWDLPGHGDSPTSSTCALGTQEAADLIELISVVRGESGDGTPLVLFGSSLGAGVSLVAAGRLETAVAGVIAEAPYRVPPTPARNVLRNAALPHRSNLPPAMWGLGAWFGCGPTFARGPGGVGFDRVLHAARVSCPVLILHGDEDEVCPLADGAAIASAVPGGRGALCVLRGGHHLDLWSEPRFRREMTAAIGRFVRGVSARAGRVPTVGHGDDR